ncbi:Phage-related baseplate assembly protein [Enhygromyxa salina]|uniref:Phage-related baseplate assembly protein n=1 Tax=Enhygromyxa salina TaxID=215803 RepID=A0A2S9YDJ1_9BACT|nr:type VI secretion system tip protein TssI/VgrG [Enhygromyxa salina]PRQ03173.1 Phage-related baseplate assembly protein [Enhygromyxa salina]
MPDKLPTLGYEIESANGTLPSDVRVYRFHMTEAVSEPYTITADIVTTELDYAFEELLGHDAQLNLVRDELMRSVFGVITAIDWLGVSGDSLLLRLTIRPALALLGQQIHTRMFQALSVLDIIDQVLAEELAVYGREYTPGSVSRGAEVREYCAQYRESNLAFVERLLEEEGISYTFVHDDGASAELLELIDAPEQLGSSANIDGSDLFPLIALNPSEADVESIQAIEWRRRVTSTGVLRRDFDWQAPTSLLDSETDTPDAHGRTRRVYLHGGRRFFSDDLSDRAGDHKAALAQPGARGYGRSNVTSFHAGLKFNADGHVLEPVAEELILIRVEHEGHDPSALPSLESHSDVHGGYSNMFECVPASIELRPPPLTPKPHVRGPQTAIVTGPGGEEIHVDEFGRVSVQFYWDEKPPYDDTSSCWVRVAQRWAGPAWGAQFIPRVGMEVVVDFLEGNPDRPLITGCVYNGANSPPYSLPDNKTQSGVKTNSSPGGDGSNELRFEDAAGGEEIYIHAQKDWTIAVENDKHQTVGHDESLEVVNDRKKHVKHDEVIKVDNDETITIGNDHSETINHNMSVTVVNDQRVTIGNNHSETIANNRTETIANNASETVGASKTVTVAAAMQVSVGGALNASVGGAVGVEVGGAMAMAVGGKSSETVGDTKSVEVGKELIIKAGEAGQISTGKALGITSDDALTISSTKDISVSGKAKALIEAADELTIKCGSAKIVLKKSGDIAISGGKIDVKGSGKVSVKGAKIANN